MHRCRGRGGGVGVWQTSRVECLLSLLPLPPDQQTNCDPGGPCPQDCRKLGGVTSYYSLAVSGFPGETAILKGSELGSGVILVWSLRYWVSLHVGKQDLPTELSRGQGFSRPRV